MYSQNEKKNAELCNMFSYGCNKICTFQEALVTILTPNHYLTIVIITRSSVH